MNWFHFSHPNRIISQTNIQFFGRSGLMRRRILDEGDLISHEQAQTDAEYSRQATRQSFQLSESGGQLKWHAEQEAHEHHPANRSQAEYKNIEHPHDR